MRYKPCDIIQEHDGCEGCDYEKKGFNEEPCVDCKGNADFGITEYYIRPDYYNAVEIDDIEYECSDCVYFEAGDDIKEPCCNCKYTVDMSSPEYKKRPLLFKAKEGVFEAEEEVGEESYGRWTDNKKVHPEHYNNSKITPFDVWDDWKLDPYTATAIKYIKRAGSKDGESAKDDLEKAIDYLKERITRLG